MEEKALLVCLVKTLFVVPFDKECVENLKLAVSAGGLTREGVAAVKKISAVLEQPTPAEQGRIMAPVLLADIDELFRERTCSKTSLQITSLLPPSVEYFSLV